MTATRSRPSTRSPRVVQLDDHRRRSRPVAEQRVEPRRWWIILGCFAVLAAVTVAKLVQVQLGDAPDLAGRGQAVREYRQIVPAVRGSIVDRNGVDLAVSVPEADVALSRKALNEAGQDGPEDLAAVAAAVGPALGVPERRIAAVLGRADATDDHVVVAEGVSLGATDVAHEELVDLNLQGIMGVEVRSERVHPAGESGLRLVGTLDADGRPTEMGGIERRFDDLLTGRDGRRVGERSQAGRTIVGSERVQEVATPGHDVELTLDRTLQYEAERLLAAGVERSGAAGGVAIVGRPSTGELLAVAGAESDRETGEVGLASGPLAFSDAFQAGSVFKLVTAAAAYEHGVVDDDTTFTVPWRIDVADRTFEDHHQHPTEQMRVDDVIAESSNVGTIQMGRLVGAERLHRALADFGFGSPTDVGHPAESGGLLPDVAGWTEPDLAAASIGTFQSATVLQLWAAYNVIANGGEYVAPRLVNATVAPDGTRTAVERPPTRRVVSEAAAQRVDRALRAVVSGGTAKDLAIPGYVVAAKTGTGRMPSPERVDASDDYVWADGTYHYVTTFAGYLPADRPQVSITVLLFDTPPGSSGAGSAGPVFADLARTSIRELGIGPSAVAVAPATRVRAAPAPEPAPAGSTGGAGSSGRDDTGRSGG